jgi:hypothetical protein
MNYRYLLLVLFIILNHSLLLAQTKCQVLYIDEFIDSSGNWPTNDINNITSYSISNGYYYIEGLHKKRASLVLQSIWIDESENFEIEASIKKISGSKKNGYGLCFGLSDDKNHFSFAVNDKGKFRFYKRKDGENEKIIPWTESEYINRGTGVANKLKIIKEGEKIEFYSNDHLIAMIPFQSFIGNNIGFYNERKQKIAIDYLRITYSPDNSNTDE